MLPDPPHNSSSARHAWMDAARTEVRVISALVRRETRAHFGETRLGYLWAIIEPLLHLIAYVVLFTYILRRPTPLGASLQLFMLTGMIPFFLFSKLANYLAGSIDENRSLLNLPPVKPFNVMASRAILETTTYLFVGFLLLVGISLNGVENTAPYDPEQLALALAASVAFGVGVGMTNAVLRAFFRNWMMIFGFILSPTFLLSGIWFLPSTVPPPFRGYLLYNPLMHYILWTRTAFYRGYAPDELDRGYAMSCSVLALAVGLALLRVARRKLLEPT